MADADLASAPLTVPRGVLVVCFDASTLGALVKILRKAGETALVPKDLHSAWDAIRTDTVGCVVLDLTGPAPDALGLFAAARSSSKTRTIPFLFLIDSATVVPTFERYGVGLVNDDWLKLPSSANDFLNKVRGLLSTRLMYSPPGFVQRKPGMAPAWQPVIQPEELLRAPGAVVSGMLGVLDVTRILMMLEPLHLTGALDVTDGKRYGQVFFIKGAAIHAELHDIEGPDALFLLFHLKHGAFRFELGPPTLKRTIVGNTTTLLLEGLRQMDEAKAIIKSFQDRHPLAEESAEEAPT